MIDVLVPLEQEGTEAVISNWLKAVGDQVALNDPLVELETDKVSVEVPAPVAGRLAEILVAAGSQATPGMVLARIDTADARVEGASPQPQAALDQPDMSGWHSPAVRKALAETGLDPAAITGSGRGGRLTRADVDRAAASAPDVASPAPRPKPAPVLQGQSVPHDTMRLAIARNMQKSVSEAPQVTAVFEADFSAIMAHRAAHRKAFEAQGIALSYTAYIVLAAAQAMQSVPQVNSRWHDSHLELFSDINIGVGTALGDRGLVVPVLRRVQDLSLQGVAAQLQDLTGRAREGRLTPEDMRGGTFTISNHGVSGSLLAAPILIHQQQSAILGIGKLEKRVVVRDVGGIDTIQIRPMAYVSLTIDHRVLDGHQTNAWLTRFVDALENWRG
ncbi:MAG: dihydrolipoamide succinyltransferase [Rhodobacterales bacterium 65-51]|jgi:2-oxoglutarate dehydrogenase E2 component (dihydrolipoamide succinyltransferase)|uniref:dihydrolipoamide acetyltransferase family protein n=1 Tax=uncultured Gemmobacter sp. TaxID=1095917 RepID=UPI000963BC4C|nr:2-oxo acid dehydrogenase subunit E2 [uncultured Gemmobacter sp.]OJY28386.1 MAG: dihydrolipoamide succinyltransferase [Rhodobacterales bacterium 65-51]